MSCLEALPDELLLELFEEYMRIVDVYIGFYPLNHRRLNAVIKSIRFCVNLPSKDVFHRASFAYFAPQIVSLHVSAFCKDLDLSTLVNLQYLHIEKPTNKQLTSIQPVYLPHLRYLSLSPCWYHPSELPQVLAALPQSCAFEHLRRCALPDGRTLRFSRGSKPADQEQSKDSGVFSAAV